MKKIKGHFDQKVLLSLIENYKERGFFEDADDCYYFFRKSRRKYLFPLLRPFDLALMAFYGYGTKPFWAFMWFVSIFAVFGVAYLIFGRSMGFTSAISPLEAINISSAVILSGTKLVESPQPNTSILYLIFMIEKLLGSLFFFLFLVSVGRTIIR